MKGLLINDLQQESQDNANYLALLKEQFYFHVPFPLEPIAITQAVEAFLEFLQQPEAIKSHINFTIAPTHRRGDIGYRKRIADDIYNDNKEFFHYHPAVWEKYPDFIQQNPVVEQFLKKVAPIWETAYEVAKQILQNFDDIYPGAFDKIFKTDCPHFLLRFLKYDWQTSDKYLAKPHYDAGSFSMAIAESCPGLRIGSGPENLKIVPYKPGQAVFMLSSNFKKVFPSAEDLSAGWHDVIQMDETQLGKPFARWAVVAFMEAHGVEALPRTETHKWFLSAEENQPQ